MAGYIFDDLLARGIRAGQVPGRTTAARQWFRSQARTFDGLKSHTLLRKNPSKLTSELMLGQMFLFAYDPKWKKELPFYDQFPLIFPFHASGDHFIGINMHYLPLNLRANLMDALYGITNNKKFDATTKLRLSYQLLNSSSKFKYFKPTVHKYLISHVRSRFLMIDSVEWDVALFLPLHKFKKASASKVWAESRKKI